MRERAGAPWAGEGGTGTGRPDEVQRGERLAPHPPWGGILPGVKPEHKQGALNRLKTVRGHLNAVIDMIEDERYCPEVMKQVSALQSSLEKVNRILLQNHLETCVAHAVAEGRTIEIVQELMETMKYTAAITGPAPVRGAS